MNEILKEIALTNQILAWMLVMLILIVLFKN
jgi:hypothetical protein